MIILFDTCIKLSVHQMEVNAANYADMFISMYKYPYMIMIVIYCKIKIKQALYKHKCDKVPLNVIMCIESLTAKYVHIVYHSNAVVYSN